MKTRTQIKKERILKGFCVCHECVEREYESQMTLLVISKRIKKEVFKYLKSKP